MAYEKFGNLIKINGDNAWSSWTNLSEEKKLGSIIFVDSTLDTIQDSIKCKLIYAGGIQYNIIDSSKFDLLYNYVHALAKVASTGKASDVSTDTIQGATYDITSNDISQIWINTVNNNKLLTTDSIEDVAEKLDNKIAGLADELIADEYTINGIFSTLKSKIGLEADGALDLSTALTDDLKDDTTVKEAILTLESQIYELSSNTFSGKASDIINDTIEGAIYNSSVDATTSWVQVIEDNKLSNEDSIETTAEKLDNKIAGLADEVITNEYVITAMFSNFRNTIGLTDDSTLDLSSAIDSSLKNTNNIKDAILLLEKQMILLLQNVWDVID